jgi:hypothetical protein
VKYAFSLNQTHTAKGIWEGFDMIVWFTASLKRVLAVKI